MERIAQVSQEETNHAILQTLAGIRQKRMGEQLSDDLITAAVHGYCRGQVADYQMAAWLATMASKGMSHAETVALTQAYVDSGVTLRIPSKLRPVVDKHSTGGVGDKTTLVVAPIVAACGVRVCKLSGRGLGYAGGTIDKLESISGLRVDLTAAEMIDVLEQTGLVVSGQSDDIVPGDRATYALRDVTATVDSLPLIAASIMSKKLATAADGVVLDVKFGRGGLVPDLETAKRLAQMMIDIGVASGLNCHAVLSDMNQPLGKAIGNALEVREALDILRGLYVPGFSELCTTVAALMVRSADPRLSADDASDRVQSSIDTGKALEQLRKWIGAQGGNVQQIDDPALLPAARHLEIVRATHAGWVQDVDARSLGELAATLGAGRTQHHSTIDHAVGLVLHKRVGDRVTPGEALAEVHLNEHGPIKPLLERVRLAFSVGDTVTRAPGLVAAVISGAQ